MSKWVLEHCITSPNAPRNFGKTTSTNITQSKLRYEPQYISHSLLGPLTHLSLPIPPFPIFPSHQPPFTSNKFHIGKPPYLYLPKCPTGGPPHRYKTHYIKFHKTIRKYRHTLLTSRGLSIEKILYESTNFFSSFMDQYGNILITPFAISSEIYKTQHDSFKRQAPPSLHQLNHTITCTCEVHNYPRHNDNRFILQPRGPPLHHIHSSFNRTTYDESLKFLSMCKVPSFNDILKALLTQFHDMFLFF